MIYAYSNQHVQLHRGTVTYAMNVLLHAIDSGHLDGTRGTQDRILATVVEMEDTRMNSADYDAVRYVVKEGEILFVPHTALFRYGGYISADTLLLTNPIKNSARNSFPVTHIEIVTSTSQFPGFFDEPCDPRSDIFYFGACNFIPPQHFDPSSVSYTRSTEPLRRWQVRSHLFNLSHSVRALPASTLSNVDLR